MISKIKMVKTLKHLPLKNSLYAVALILYSIFQFGGIIKEII